MLVCYIPSSLCRTLQEPGKDDTVSDSKHFAFVSFGRPGKPALNKENSDAVTSTSLDMVWDASVATRGVALQGYEVQILPLKISASDAPWKATKCSAAAPCTATSAVFDGLDAGIGYQFRTRSYAMVAGKKQTSAWSLESEPLKTAMRTTTGSSTVPTSTRTTVTTTTKTAVDATTKPTGTIPDLLATITSSTTTATTIAVVTSGGAPVDGGATTGDTSGVSDPSTVPGDNAGSDATTASSGSTTTTISATTTTAATTTSTTTTATCNGAVDPVVCAIKYRPYDCKDPVDGERIRNGCPVLCNSCTTTTTTKATDTVTTTTTTYSTSSEDTGDGAGATTESVEDPAKAKVEADKKVEKLGDDLKDAQEKAKTACGESQDSPTTDTTECDEAKKGLDEVQKEFTVAKSEAEKLGKATPADDDDDDSTGMIIGIVVTLILIVFIVFIFLMMRKRRADAERDVEADPKLVHKQTYENPMYGTVGGGGAGASANTNAAGDGANGVSNPMYGQGNAAATDADDDQYRDIAPNPGAGQYLDTAPTPEAGGGYLDVGDQVTNSNFRVPYADGEAYAGGEGADASLYSVPNEDDTVPDLTVSGSGAIRTRTGSTYTGFAGDGSTQNAGTEA